LANLLSQSEIHKQLKSLPRCLPTSSGNGTEAQNNVVCANAGMAIATTTKCTPLEGFQIAKESLISGKGLKALTTLQELSKATNPKRETLDRNSIIKTLKYKMNILDKIIVDKRREVILKNQSFLFLN
jgi:hypothetical protein